MSALSSKADDGSGPSVRALRCAVCNRTYPDEAQFRRHLLDALVPPEEIDRLFVAYSERAATPGPRETETA